MTTRFSNFGNTKYLKRFREQTINSNDNLNENIVTEKNVAVSIQNYILLRKLDLFIKKTEIVFMPELNRFT